MEGRNNITNQTLLQTMPQQDAIVDHQTSTAPEGDTTQVALLVQ